MKLHFLFILFSLLISSLAGYGVSTNPVGYKAIQLLGGSDNRMGIPFERTPLFQGRIKAIDTDTKTITVFGDPGWETDQFVPAHTSEDPGYALLLTGEEEGMRLRIVANSSNTITVALGRENLQLLKADDSNETGDFLKIVPFWTPATLFENVSLPDRAILALPNQETAGINKAPSKYFTYVAGDGSGWYDEAGNLVDNYPLKKGEGLLLQLPEGSEDIQFRITGSVPVNAQRKRLSAFKATLNDQIFSIGAPEEVALAELGLPQNDRITVAEFDNTGRGFNKAPAKIFTFFAGHGWYDGNFNASDNYVLQPEKCYLLRMPAETAEDIDYVIKKVPAYLSR